MRRLHRLFHLSLRPLVICLTVVFASAAIVNTQGSDDDRLLTIPAPVLPTPVPLATAAPNTGTVIAAPSDLDASTTSCPPIGTDPIFTIPVTQVAIYLVGESICVGSTNIPRNAQVIGLLLCGGSLVLLVLLRLFLRVLFPRRRRFPSWQPAYANVPPLDPNSVAGRRQGWQQHAQNGTILGAPVEGNVHPIKLLLGSDGHKLGNWRLTATRLVQYDQYGRIARSETILGKRWLRGLNRVMRRNHKLDAEKLRVKLRPLARSAIGRLRRKITSKTAWLPIAMDMRFVGRHGEVRIVFELYQYRQQTWHRLDTWQPEMRITSNRIEENYTYSIHGKAAGENLRAYARRLQGDVLWLLVDTLRSEAPQQDRREPQEQPYNVPDTLGDMAPVANNWG